MKESSKNGPVTGGEGMEGRGKESPLTWIIPALIGLAVVGKVTLDRLTLVKPAWPPRRAGEPVPALPQPGDTPFRSSPAVGTFKQRRRRYLDWVARQPAENDRDAIWAEILRMEGGREQISEEILDWSLEFVNMRNDCADFAANALLRLWFKYAGSGKLKPRQEAVIKETLLNFIYWMDEPNPLKTDINHYTENHQIMFHTAEYLAGQLFPRSTFYNNGRSGRWHMDHARPLIDRWIDYHSRTGFAEWDSPNYYFCNLAALLNLVDFADDETLSTRAAMLVDLLLFDIAVDSYRGQYSSSHGRAEDHHLKSAAGDPMVTTQALLWGWGRFQSASDMAAASLASTVHYRLPPVLEAVAHDLPAEMTNYERHSIKLTAEDAFKHDLRCKNIHDVPRWLGMGVFLHPQIIGTVMDMADEWDLWHLGGAEYDRYKNIIRHARRLGLPLAGIKGLGIDLAGAELTEVNKITYRTPDYMLSCAQDYRKGEMGYQQHIWQATLSPYAVVFVTNPDSMREDGLHRPGYWAGNGRLPRAVQHRNLLIALYDIDRNRGLLESGHHAFTHAYFPRFAFDEVVEKRVFPGGGWVFGRKDDGYIALYSHLPFEWQYEGPDAAREIIAVGRRNAWICLMGRREIDGTFEEFMQGVFNSALRVEGLNVDFDAPRIGRVQFGWNSPLTVKDREIPLGYYPRWHNPYSHTEFNTGRVKIAHGGKELLLDFDRGRRIMS